MPEWIRATETGSRATRSRRNGCLTSFFRVRLSAQALPSPTASQAIGDRPHDGPRNDVQRAGADCEFSISIPWKRLTAKGIRTILEVSSNASRSAISQMRNALDRTGTGISSDIDPANGESGHVRSDCVGLGHTEAFRSSPDRGM